MRCQCFYSAAMANSKLDYSSVLVIPENLIKEVKEIDKLSGSLSKSSPLDFGTKNNFPSFFVSGRKGLAHIYIKSNLLFSSFLFLLCYEPKLNFGRTAVADRDQKGKLIH